MNTRESLQQRVRILTEACNAEFCCMVGEVTNNTSTNLAVTYGFRMQCGAQTHVSSHVMIEWSNRTSTTFGQNCIANNKKSAMSSMYHSGRAENTAVGFSCCGRIVVMNGPSTLRPSI